MLSDLWHDPAFLAGSSCCVACALLLAGWRQAGPRNRLSRAQRAGLLLLTLPALLAMAQAWPWAPEAWLPAVTILAAEARSSTAGQSLSLDPAASWSGGVLLLLLGVSFLAGRLAAAGPGLPALPLLLGAGLGAGALMGWTRGPDVLLAGLALGAALELPRLWPAQRLTWLGLPMAGLAGLAMPPRLWPVLLAAALAWLLLRVAGRRLPPMALLAVVLAMAAGGAALLGMRAGAGDSIGWELARSALAAHPWLGQGLGSAEAALAVQRAMGDGPAVIAGPPPWPLALTLGLGLPGALALVMAAALLLAPLGPTLRRAEAAAAGPPARLALTGVVVLLAMAPWGAPLAPGLLALAALAGGASVTALRREQAGRRQPA